jgi:hypothetical protein
MADNNKDINNSDLLNIYDDQDNNELVDTNIKSNKLDNDTTIEIDNNINIEEPTKEVGDLTIDKIKEEDDLNSD